MIRLIFIFLCSAAMFLLGASPRIIAQVSSNRITPYESLTYRITVDVPDGSNYGAVQTPELPDDLPFSVKSHPRSVTSSTHSSYINGQRTFERKYTVVFNYELTPLESGALIIPAVQVKFAGESYSTDPIVINVEESASSPHRLVSLVQILPKAATLGSEVTLSLQIRIPANGEYSGITPVIQWEELEKIADFTISPEHLEWKSDDKVENGIAMREFSLTIGLRPRTAGNFTISPFGCLVNVPVEDRRRRSPFDEFFGIRTKKLTFTSNELSFTVSPLPTENQPPDFSGIIGSDVKAEAQIESADYSVGDPILLNITISGAGGAKYVRLSNDTLEKYLSPAFRVSGDDPPVAQQNRALFQRTIRAATDKITEIPSISIPYYDPEAAEYRNAVTSPIPITIKAARQITLQDAAIAGGNSAVSEDSPVTATEISRADAGLAPDRPADQMLQKALSPLDKWGRYAPWFITPAAIWMLLLCAKFLIALCTLSPRKKRIRAAEGKCRCLLKKLNGNEADAAKQLHDAFQELFAAKYRLIPGTITFNDLKRAAVRLTPEQLDTLQKFFSACENARYAGGTVDLSALVNPLMQTLSEI